MYFMSALLCVCVCVRARAHSRSDAYSFVHCRFWQARGEQEDGETELGQRVAELPTASVTGAGCLRRDWRPLGKILTSPARIPHVWQGM